MILSTIMAILIVCAWAVAFIKLRQKKIALGEFLIWSLLWVTLFIFAEFPIIPSYIASLFGISRGVDLVVYTSIFVLFFVVFRIYVRIEEQDRKMTQLVREIAIKRSKK
jgi:small membrane protein